MRPDFAPGSLDEGAGDGSPSARGRRVVVGDLELRACDVAPRALCGSIRRSWEPGNPAAGKVRVGFALVPPRDRSRPAIGTVVPHEGGPGYATTDSAWGYRRMYGPLLERRNMLLVDQRGTGRSEPVDCPMLQHLQTAYPVAAGRCGRLLGDRSDDYRTVLAVDDTAAVIRRLDLGPVDLYGDSYGTFFQQVHAGRHPDQVRSVFLDAAYPTYGESAWFPTQGPALRRAFTAVCERSSECAEAGRPFLGELRAVLDRVRRQPWTGTAYDADGVRARVEVNGKNLVADRLRGDVLPPHYRELTAALRSALAGDRAPLLRLVAEATGGSTDAGPIELYSEGAYPAVVCHETPLLYDMAAPLRVRKQQYDDALDRRQQQRPNTFGPFTVHEYAQSDWQFMDWCLRWPAPPASHPAEPPRPPGGSYPDVPVLVLSGEMDSITTAAEGDIILEQFPNARHVVMANSFHVNASYDLEGCGPAYVRAFVRDPEGPLPDCAADVPPLRAPGVFPRRLADVLTGHVRRAARPATASRGARRGPGRRGRDGPLLEQLLRPRRRTARRHLVVLRVHDGALPAPRHGPHPRPAGQRLGDLGPQGHDRRRGPDRARPGPGRTPPRHLGHPRRGGGGGAPRPPRRRAGPGRVPGPLTPVVERPGRWSGPGGPGQGPPSPVLAFTGAEPLLILHEARYCRNFAISVARQIW